MMTQLLSKLPAQDLNIGSKFEIKHDKICIPTGLLPSEVLMDPLSPKVRGCWSYSD